MFSAAWAPIASDTMPASAAAAVIERVEMRSCPTFIAAVSQSFSKARLSVASTPSRFEEVADGGAVQLRSICGRAANKTLTHKDLSGNPAARLSPPLWAHG